MKTKLNLKLIAVLVLSVILFTACGEKPEDYRAQLEEKDVTYSEESFVEQGKNGEQENVELFLKAGMDPEVTDHNGNTALMLAAMNGHVDTMKLLLEQGSEVNAKNNLGKTALFYAATNGHVEAVEVLLDNDADVTVKTENGRTALDYAKQRGHTDVVELLENTEKE